METNPSASDHGGATCHSCCEGDYRGRQNFNKRPPPFLMRMDTFLSLLLLCSSSSDRRRSTGETASVSVRWRTRGSRHHVHGGGGRSCRYGDQRGPHWLLAYTHRHTGWIHAGECDQFVPAAISRKLLPGSIQKVLDPPEMKNTKRNKVSGPPTPLVSTEMDAVCRVLSGGNETSARRSHRHAAMLHLSGGLWVKKKSTNHQTLAGLADRQLTVLESSSCLFWAKTLSTPA